MPRTPTRRERPREVTTDTEKTCSWAVNRIGDEEEKDDNGTEQRPDQKYAAWLEWDEFENVWYLFMLACRDDKAEPSTCAVFVGSRSYTLAERTRFQNFQIEDTKNQPGGKATIIERSHRNERAD